MSRRNRSLSLPAIKLLSLMLEDPTADYYGLDLSKRAGILTGTVYPLLKRLEDLGWLASEVERIDAAVEGRPARRLYRLTGDGARLARAEITNLQSHAVEGSPSSWPGMTCSGQTAEEAFAELCQEVLVHHPDADLAHLGRVFGIADRAHRGQLRNSGHVYVLHSLAVANYVAGWGEPLTSVSAALLHDVPETGCDLRHFPDDVSSEVVDLVSAVAALRPGDDPVRLLTDAGVDPVARQFIERIMILKIADRLHNVHTLRFVPAVKAARRLAKPWTSTPRSRTGSRCPPSVRSCVTWPATSSVARTTLRNLVRNSRRPVRARCPGPRCGGRCDCCRRRMPSGTPRNGPLIWRCSKQFASEWLSRSVWSTRLGRCAGSDGAGSGAPEARRGGVL